MHGAVQFVFGVFQIGLGDGEDVLNIQPPGGPPLDHFGFLLILPIGALSSVMDANHLAYVPNFA